MEAPGAATAAAGRQQAAVAAAAVGVGAAATAAGARLPGHAGNRGSVPSVSCDTGASASSEGGGVFAGRNVVYKEALLSPAGGSLCKFTLQPLARSLGNSTAAAANQPPAGGRGSQLVP